MQEAGPDLPFVALAGLLSLAVGLVVGVFPSLKALSREMDEGAFLSGARQSSSRARSRARRALVVAEVAFSLLLLVGGGLMVRTLAALNRVDPGLESEGTLAASLSLPEARYGEDGEISSFVREVEERLSARPGVESVGTVLSLPIRSSLSGSFYFSIEGRPAREDEEVAGYQIATPGYFPTLGIPLLQGRSLAETDGPRDPLVVVVNETLRT